MTTNAHRIANANAEFELCGIHYRAMREYHRRFERIAATIRANASTYPTLAVCRMMAGRLTRAYERDGSYGCMAHTYREALRIVHDRHSELYYAAWDAARGITYDASGNPVFPAE